MKSILAPALVVILCAAGFSMQEARVTASIAPSDSELREMPAVTLFDLDGAPVDYESLKGNIVVLDFWATWCGPCIVEIPHYNKLQEKYAGKGVKIVGVTLTSGPAAEVKPFVAKHNMQYTIFMGDDDQTYDFNIVGFPTTYVLTPDWKIYRKYVGAGPLKKQQLEGDIKKLLSQINK